MAMLAFLAGDDWETSPAQQAGTSPAGIGGTLEQFPSALFPAVRPCFADPDIERVRIEAGIDCSKVRIDPNLTFTIVAQPLPEPTPSIVEAASARVAAQGGTLTESEMRHVLAEAGFVGDLLEQALRVSHGESVGWQPAILGDGGRAYGLFQIHPAVWIGGGVCEGPWASLLEPLPNARCAKLILDYEAARRYPLWSNWTVKP